jgi:amidase
VFGRTLNPYNRKLTPGGSSGGEGALIGIRGSLLGVGTDLGGSIRIPGLCCGTYAFKPSTSRIASGGQQSPARAGSPGIAATAGPLATSFRDIELFTTSVIAKVPWNYDPTALIIPWRNVPSKTKLTIGILPQDPNFPIHPPVARALATAIERLQKAGHALVSIPEAPLPYEAYDTTIAMFSLDNTKTAFKHLSASGEPLIPSILAMKPSTPKQNPKPDGFSIDDVFELNVVRADYRARWANEFIKAKLDVVISPGAITTAVPHDTYGASPYTMIWNLLDVSFCFPFL